MDCNLVQPENTELPKKVILFGNLILVSDAHPVNAADPIDLTLLGIMSDVIFEQP